MGYTSEITLSFWVIAQYVLYGDFCFSYVTTLGIKIFTSTSFVNKG